MAARYASSAAVDGFSTLALSSCTWATSGGTSICVVRRARGIEGHAHTVGRGHGHWLGGIHRKRRVILTADRAHPSLIMPFAPTRSRNDSALRPFFSWKYFRATSICFRLLSTLALQLIGRHSDVRTADGRGRNWRGGSLLHHSVLAASTRSRSTFKRAASAFSDSLS